MSRVTLRPATLEDGDLLYAWRNDPETVAQSFTGRTVTLGEHAMWLERTLADRGCRLFIAEDDGQEVGTGRLDVLATGTYLSLTVAPRQRGKGYAREIIEALAEYAREWRPGARIRAQIRPGNARSIRAFLAAGFEPDCERLTVVRP